MISYFFGILLLHSCNQAVRWAGSKNQNKASYSTSLHLTHSSVKSEYMVSLTLQTMWWWTKIGNLKYFIQSLQTSLRCYLINLFLFIWIYSRVWRERTLFVWVLTIGARVLNSLTTSSEHFCCVIIIVLETYDKQINNLAIIEPPFHK